jgi:hypothetical protein
VAIIAADRRGGDPPVRLDRRVPGYNHLREVKQQTADSGDPGPAGGSGHEADRNHQAEERHDECVGGQTREADAMEVDDHRQGESNLRDG